MDVSKEDFLLAMEIIFRLYDEDGNKVVTKKEVDQISNIITQPEFAARFEGGVINNIREVQSVDSEKYVLGKFNSRYNFISFQVCGRGDEPGGIFKSLFAICQAKLIKTNQLCQHTNQQRNSAKIAILPTVLKYSRM